VATPNLDPIVLRIVELDRQIEALTAERNVHKEHLVANLSVDTHSIAGYQVIISETKPNWSAKGKREFIAQHPAINYPELYVKTIALDTDAAAEVLTQAELDAYLLDVKKYVKDIK
jgi:hypothetical protein